MNIYIVSVNTQCNLNSVRKVSIGLFLFQFFTNCVFHLMWYGKEFGWLSRLLVQLNIEREWPFTVVSPLRGALYWKKPNTMISYGTLQCRIKDVILIGSYVYYMISEKIIQTYTVSNFIDWDTQEEDVF